MGLYESTPGAGTVHVVYGGPVGLTTGPGSTAGPQPDPGADEPDPRSTPRFSSELFGFSLAAGRFGRSPVGAGLAASAPNAWSGAGFVRVINGGGPTGLTADNTQRWRQNALGVPDETNPVTRSEGMAGATTRRFHRERQETARPRSGQSSARGSWFCPPSARHPDPATASRWADPGRTRPQASRSGCLHGCGAAPGLPRPSASSTGESRNSEGPEYRAATLGGTSTLDWQVTFDLPGWPPRWRGERSAGQS